MLTLYDHERSLDATSNRQDDETTETVVRDIHELTPAPEDNSRTMTATLPPPPAFRGYFSPPRSTTTMSEGASSGENFTTISREFNALVIAGSSMENNEPTARDVMQREDERQHDLLRIHEERDQEEETNPLAIVPDQYPGSGLDPGSEIGPGQGQGRVGMTVQIVKREEVEAKITAWQTAKLAKINNRFKREDTVINGWVNEQVHKANSWMKKIERKLEERKAKAMEKTQNNVAKAQRKAEERRATAEAKRGTEVAKVVEVANLMRAVGRPPAKRSFFSFS
ncbi:Remorin C-terminal [Arabidopsis thaliana x Arabidopsis arenosa]|uniref:Remorin C-terminal n=1 Tax=Arabidopsis thaliana x Arabidopsis arenosa TaxID=1240361 RepID=A0A8T2AAG7_9BRAS|nr:Remorin C-terminal [Arabidopsis thaliana x Arabidopsis arenosa]